MSERPLPLAVTFASPVVSNVPVNGYRVVPIWNVPLNWTVNRARRPLNMPGWSLVTPKDLFASIAAVAIVK